MIKFYNTIDRKKVDFIPMVDGKISLYTCGPTVYNFAHIGNFRAYIFEDLLRRTLEFCDYEVLHVMNLTDIDDKTINKANLEKIPLKEFTDKYIAAFYEDVEALNILPAHHYPRATEFIDGMIGMIQDLESKGYTYTTEDGSVFFKISQYKDYGRLANLQVEDLLLGERVENDEYEKEEMRDFALWKSYKKEEGDIFWESPWGKGRPGWHIECSVMSTHYLGNHFDIHCGGVDNIFPHHENEIAQSCCATDEKFVNYWLHNEHLLVDNQKMSKSLGNFYTIRDLIEKGYTPQSIRYTLLSTHYRQKLNFTLDKLTSSQKSINKIKELKRRAKLISDDKIEGCDFKDESSKMILNFSNCLKNDLNISGALGEMFIWINLVFKELDANNVSFTGSLLIVETLESIDRVLGILESENNIKHGDKIVDLLEKRAEARQNKDWNLADKIREEIDALGYVVEDTDQGPIIKRK
tara:strand:+ start:218 stop:1618 length:1401 start_codon:yes stop_codon:yes gene_type:complete